MKNKINPRFCIIPTQRFSSLRNPVNGALDGKIGNFFLRGGVGGGEEHGSSPLAPEARGRHSTSTSLALKVIRIVYNPPFEKFLDPSLVLYFIVLVIVNIDGYVFLFKMDGSAVIYCPEFFLM